MSRDICDTNEPIVRFLFLPYLAAGTLSFPIALLPVMGYPTNPAFALAPLVALSFLRSWREPTAIAFAAAGICGLLSIGVAEAIASDGRIGRNLLSLTLIMFSAGFFFLGRILPPRKVLFFLGLFSAIYVLVCAAHVLWLSEDVRVMKDDGHAYLNMFFFGIPSFASFGVNALAHMVVLQATLIAGLFYSRRYPTMLTAFFGLALMAALFLAMGSDSRSTHISIIILAMSAIAYSFFARRGTLKSIIVFAMLGLVSFWHGLSDRNPRIIDTAQAVYSNISEKEVIAPWANDVKIDSGRVVLIQTALDELIQSPLIGTGFSSWGRYAPVNDQIRANSAPHNYYLTLVWKGGILFALPFSVFLTLCAVATWSARPWFRGSALTFATFAVALLMVPMALTYETPAVPSAGALGFLLLGLISSLNKSKSRQYSEADE